MTEEVYQKRCFRCKETKFFENFNKNRTTQDGFAQECKACKSITQRAYIERLKAQGKLPFALQKVSASCQDCGVERVVFRKTLRAGKWRCLSCAMRICQNTPEMRQRKSIAAKKQVLRQGGIPNAVHFTSDGSRGSNSPSWKGGKPDCVDCGKRLSIRGIDRCHKCSALLRTGERHPNWKGGITPQNAKDRSSGKYARWRKSVFVKDQYTCQLCGQVGGKLQAHHKKGWADHKELRYALDNGVTLCRPCHLNKAHQGSWKNKGLDIWQ